MVQYATLALLVLSSNIEGINEEAISGITSYYSEDLPSPRTLIHELDSWKSMWVNKVQKPSSIMDTLQNPNSNPKVFPNIAHILKSLLLLPVTSSTVERANSALKFVKTCRRNRTENDRLNALLLLFVHSDLLQKLNIDNAVSRFAEMNPRQMTLLHILQD